jgi:hypothetical protein
MYIEKLKRSNIRYINFMLCQLCAFLRVKQIKLI